jgi:hypothetical protein
MIIVAMLAVATRAHADSWSDVVAIVRVSDDTGRIGVGPLAGVGIGNGWQRDTSGGARAEWFAYSDVVFGAEVRQVAPGTIGLGPVPGAAASADLGYLFVHGKIAGGQHVLHLDLVASAGAGAVWLTRERAPSLTAGLAARVHLSDGVVLELGVHDDVYAGGPALLELRAGLSWMWPGPHEHCITGGRRNPLEGQPAVRD